MKQLLLFALTVFTLSACGGKSKHAVAETGGSPITLHHASNLLLTQYDDYVLATLRNPWDTTRVLQTYILVDRNQALPTTLPQGVVVRTPVQKALVYSSVHCGLLQQLDALNSIAGVCDLKYIRLPDIQTRSQDGRLVDAGDSMNPDMEKIIDLHPDAILLSPFENSGGYGRIEKLNVPIIECADYMETSPLARAEWMRFYGLLFGKQLEADALFEQVESEYLALRELASVASPKPTVLSDLKEGSAWYVAGGRSTTAGFIADAGGRYLFAENPNSGSVPLAFETVFDKGQDADLWLIKYNQPTDKTYRELKKDYAPYAGFRAFKERNIYGCNTGTTSVYEEYPFAPQLLLKEFIKVMHPSLLPAYQLTYYTHLAD